MKDLFLNEVDIDTENSFYIFILNDDDTEENMSLNFFKND